jgi:beta-glucosidase
VSRRCGTRETSSVQRLGDLLFGNATPNGRLPQTWPATERQGPGRTQSEYPGVYSPNPTTPTALNESFDEGVDIGYCYYQADHETPLCPFGFGLSYTKVSDSPLTLTRAADGTETASTTISNTGAEVAQLYLRFPAAAGEAPWNLKAFDKVYLKPGQRQTVSFPITDQMLQNYNVDQQQWNVTPGIYWLAVGDSSADLESGASFHVGGWSWHVRPNSRRRPKITKVTQLSMRALRQR